MKGDFKLSTFVVKVAIGVLLLAFVWPMVGPLCDQAVVAAANGVLALQGHSVELWADQRGTLRAAARSPVFQEHSSPITSFYLRESWGGLILLLALFIGIPRPVWKKRLLLLLPAVVLLFLFYTTHVLLLLANHLFLSYSFYVWMFSFGRIWLPVLLWGIFTFRYWFPGRPGHPHTETFGGQAC